MRGGPFGDRGRSGGGVPRRPGDHTVSTVDWLTRHRRSRVRRGLSRHALWDKANLTAYEEGEGNQTVVKGAKQARRHSPRASPTRGHHNQHQL